MGAKGIWSCKIGATPNELPHGSDLPMRQAVAIAYEEITGVEPDFIFSGWSASLTEGEQQVLDNKSKGVQWKPKHEN